jgi:hypothetical protein
MIQAVGSLSDIIHLDIKPTFDAAKSSIENWDQQVQSEGVPALATKLSLAANKLTSASKQIDEILSANARYDSEIRLTVHDRDPGPFVRELGFFSSDISNTVDLSSQNRAAVLASDLERLRQAIITYDNWVYAAADNADYKVQSLRAYRPAGSKKTTFRPLKSEIFQNSTFAPKSKLSSRVYPDCVLTIVLFAHGNAYTFCHFHNGTASSSLVWEGPYVPARPALSARSITFELSD